MTIKQVENYLRRYGMQIYEMQDEKDKRKRYYKLLYPIFNGPERRPSSNGIRLEKRAIDIYLYAKSLLDNEEYRERCKAWWINNF